eukprot:7860479-Pyramimonas_sp.AAC.2
MSQTRGFHSTTRYRYNRDKVRAHGGLFDFHDERVIIGGSPRRRSPHDKPVTHQPYGKTLII